MPKLTGTDPRAGRKTLGQALEDLANNQELDFDSAVATIANKGSNGKDSQVAKGVMGRNTYPSTIDSLKNSAAAVPYKDGRPLNQGLVDIAPAARKAVAAVAQDAMAAYNDYVPSETASEDPGGRRGDNIPSAQANEAETFTKKLIDAGGIDQVLAKVNFDQLSGGASSGLLSGLLKNQGGFFTAPQIQEIIDKIGSSGDVLKTSMLLASVKGENGSDPNARPKGDIASNIHDNLDATNRYAPSPQSPYIKDPTANNEEVFYKDGLFSIQVGAGKLGVYDKNGKGIKTMDLSRMAMQLMTSAQSHGSLAGMIDEGFAKGSAGGGSFLFDLAALIPGVTQIGAARIEQGLMRIKNTPLAGELGIDGAGADDIIPVVSGDVILGAGPSSRTPGQIDPRSAGSYGNMNSFVEPFDGPMPFGMFFIALYSILAVMLLSLIIDGIANAAGGFGIGKSAAPSNPSSPNTLELGHNSRGGGGDDIASLFMTLFGLPKLDFNFFNCLMRGLERFYDFPNILDLISGNAGFEEVLETAVNLALAPGYYATITKQVLRDFEQITEAILAIGQNASVFNVIAGIFKIVEVLFSSFTFRFVVFLCNLGNIDLLSKKSYGVHSTGELVVGVDDNSKSLNSSLPRTPYSRMRLSRFGDSNPLSLSFYPAMFNVPAFGPGISKGSFTVGEGDPVMAETLVGNLEKARIMMSPDAKNTKEHLRQVEDALDVEYMPFYVHDLRNDELFSMPAFISSFSEDFGPEYNETHGYGRTDPVLIYSKTKRNMAIDFKLVSFNETDHDYMWFVINKLVAMCYPQRSAGQKRIVDENKHFIQPFSQTPTASPLIRLRLGEVVKSNYSKKALGRLHGLFGAPGVATVAEIKPDDAAKNYVVTFKRTKQQLIDQAIEAIKEKTEVPEFDVLIKPGQMVTVSNGQTSVVCKVASSAGKDNLTVVKGLPMKIDKVNLNRDKKGINKLEFVGTIAKKGIFDSVDDIYKTLNAVPAAKQLLNPDETLPPDLSTFPTLKVTGKFYVEQRSLKHGTHIDFDPIQVGDAAMKKVDKAIKSKGLNPSDEKNVNFMDAKNNPIVASFEATRGRGLAGFITALSLDYTESNWETTPGSRAPQTVSVSMTFSPVHDLPLGLDAHGQLLAPSHPVGGLVGTDPYDELIDDGKDSKGRPAKYLDDANQQSFTDAVGKRKNVNMK